MTSKLRFGGTVRGRRACQAAAPGVRWAASAALGAACVAFLACSSTAEMGIKTGEWTAPTFESAEGFSALVTEAPELASSGKAPLAFAADAQAVALVVPLNKGASLRVSAKGSPELDTVLALYGPADDEGFYGREPLTIDDDSGEGLLSQIDGFIAVKRGLYLVLVSTFDGTGRGPVELSVAVDGQPGYVALLKDVPNLDVLFVVDSSPSMVQEQTALVNGFREFLGRLDPNNESDLRIAVTTTNVCPAGKQGAVRGRFAYQPAVSLPPAAIVKRVVPCLSDADCQERTDLPDAANWVCEAGMPQGQWACDVPPDLQEAGLTDDYPGDVLFAIGSQCRYKCTRDQDPTTCTGLFGVGPRCRATCTDAGCSATDCANVGYPTDRCERACGTSTCQGFCQAYLGSAVPCTTVCAKAGQETCSAYCAGGTVDPAEVAVDGTFPGQRFLCEAACQGATSCDDRCVAEFREEGEQPYHCMYPADDPAMAGCALEPIGPKCPPGVPTILTRQVARDYAARWRQGEWRGEPSWQGLADADLERRVLARLLQCQAFVGADQLICNNQEQGLRAAWLALDPNGENRDQATQFHREDASLVVVVISDEDDCSAPEYEKSPGQFDNVVRPENYSRCACLRDESGCLNGGQCDPAACLTGDEFDAAKCPLLATSQFVTRLRGLKGDPAKVMFAAIVGGVVPGSATSPSDDATAIRQRYYDCKCDLEAPRTAPMTYACLSDLGQADQGDRYAATVTGFGDRGWFGNICEGVDLAGLAAFVRRATGADPLP